jgi:hypothetical protein
VDRLDRTLALAAGPADEESAERLRPLRRLLLVWSAARSVLWLGYDAPMDAGALALCAAVLAGAAALAFVPRLEHHAARLALPALALQLVWTLPLTSNHFFFELYATALLALAGPGGRGAPLVLQGCRWLVAIVLLQTGLQKLLYGHYFHGDFLAWMIGRGDRFADLFAWVVPAADVARLEGLAPFARGAGPYRIEQPLFVLLSNAVWIAEVVLPAALIWRRTRTAAAAVALALVAALQLGAREVGFALVFGNGLLLFAPAAWHRRALPIVAALLVLALLASVGLLPGRDWLAAANLW